MHVSQLLKQGEGALDGILGDILIQRNKSQLAEIMKQFLQVYDEDCTSVRHVARNVMRRYHVISFFAGVFSVTQ